MFAILRSGWKSALQNKLILVFALLTQASLLDYALPPQWRNPASSLAAIRFIWLGFIVFLQFAGAAGMLYIVYCAAVNQPTSLSATWAAVVRSLWRILGASCLAVGLGLCLLILFTALYTRGRPESVTPLPYLRLAWLPLAATTGFWDFTLIGVVARDLSLRRAWTEAWRKFWRNFGSLAGLGAALGLGWLLFDYIAALGGLFVGLRLGLVQAGPVNDLNPWAPMAASMIYVVPNHLGAFLYHLLSAGAFVTAYLEYGAHPLPRVPGSTEEPSG